MSANNLVRSPLQMPINSPQFLKTYIFSRAPTIDDWRNFEITDMWVFRQPSTPMYAFYVLVDKPAGQGIWLNLSSNATPGIVSLTPDSGGVVLPDGAGNINVLGGVAIHTTGTPNTITVNNTMTLTPDTGGAVAISGGGTINVIGGKGVKTVGTANTVTINCTVNALTWIVDTTSPVSPLVGEGHLANGVGAITYNMPATTVVGDGLAFIDMSGNGFVIQCGGGQIIHVGNQATSAGGTITSSTIGDAIFMVCSVPNTTFFAFSLQGNLTIA